MSKRKLSAEDDWILRLRPLPHGYGEPDATQRMRRLLKAALRVYGFRAVDYRGVKRDDIINVERDKPPFAPQPGSAPSKEGEI